MDYDRTLPVDIEHNVASPNSDLRSGLVTSNVSSLNDTAMTATSGIEQSVILGFSPEKQSMKELEHQYQQLKKENFELKLRLYYLQEQLKRQTGQEGSVSEHEIKLSVRLQVQVDRLQEEKKQIQTLLLQAKTGMDSLTDKQSMEMAELKRAASVEVARLKAQLQEQVQQAQQTSRAHEHERQELQGQLVVVEAMNAELSQALKARTQELTSLQSHQAACLQQLDQKREDLTALDSELKDSKFQAEQLEMKLARISPLSDEVNHLRMRVRDLEHADRDLQDELKQRESHFNELETEKNKQQVEHQRVVAEMKQLQRATIERTQHHYQDLLEKQNRKISELQSDLERVADDRRDRDRQLDRLTEDLRRKETEMQKLRSDVNSKDHKVAVLEVELTQKAGEMDRSADNAARSRKALQDLTDSVQNKDKEIQRLQSIIHSRDRALSQSQENMQHVETRAKLAEEQAQTIKQQKSRMAQIEADLRAQTAQSQRLRQELHDKQLGMEQTSSVKDLEIRKLQDAVHEKEQEVQLMKDQMQHASDMASKKATLLEQHFKSDRQTLNETLSSRNKVISDLKQRLSEQEIQLEQMKDISSQQAQTIKDMESNAQRQQQAMNELQARILSKTSEMTKVEGRLGEVASEKDVQISELRQVIEELRRQKLETETRMQKEMAQLQEMNRMQQSELATKAGEVASLLQSVREKNDRLENLKRQGAEDQSQYHTTSQRLSLEQEEKRQLEMQVKALTLQVVNGQKALESLNERLQQSMQVNEALQQRLLDAEKRIKQLSPNSETTRRAADLQEYVDQSRKNTDRLQRRLAAVERENETLRERLSSSISPEKQSRLIAENEGLKVQLSESRHLNETLRQSLHELHQQSVVAASPEKAEVEKLKSQLRECKRVNDDLQSRIDEVTAAAKAAGIHPGTGSPIRGSRLAREMESWRSKLADSEHQVRLLQARLDTEMSKAVSLGAQAQQIALLQEQLVEVQTENSRLKEKLADLDSQLRQSEGGRVGLESLVKSHAKEVVGLKGRLSDSHKETRRLKAVVDELQKENQEFLRANKKVMWDGPLENRVELDSEAALARQRASLLYSQLKETAQLNASLCSQLDQLEQSLSADEEPLGYEPADVLDNGEELGNGQPSSHHRSQKPAIVVTDVDEQASEIVPSQDPALISLITAGSDQSLSQYVQQIKDLKQQLIVSQQSNEALREQLRAMIHEGVGLTSLTGGNHWIDARNSQEDLQAQGTANSHEAARLPDLGDLCRRLKETNDRKEHTARSIYDRILKTHRVLQQAQTNLQRQANGNETGDV